MVREYRDTSPKRQRGLPLLALRAGPDESCFLHSDSAHVTAFLGTVPARLGAALAMLFRVFAAFLGAGFANVGTDAAHFRDEMRAAAHEGDAQPAHLGAIKASTGTIGPAAETLVGAMVAFLSTATASGDTRLMLLMRHDRNLLKPAGWSQQEKTGNRSAVSGVPAHFFSPAFTVRHGI